MAECNLPKVETGVRFPSPAQIDYMFQGRLSLLRRHLDMPQATPETWVEVDENGVGWSLTRYKSAPGTVFAHEQTNKKQLPVKLKNFRCPICDGTEYEPIYQDQESGFHSRPSPLHDIIGPGPNAGRPQTTVSIISGYRCPNCTIHFEDPTKFSRNQPAEIIVPVAIERPNDRLIRSINKRM